MKEDLQDWMTNSRIWSGNSEKRQMNLPKLLGRSANVRHILDYFPTPVDRVSIGTEPKPKDGSAKSKDGKRAPAPVFTKKEVATLKQRIEILDWYQANGKNQSKTAKHFAPIYPNLVIKQPLISSWVKEEAKWRERWAKADCNVDRSSKRQHQTQHPEVTEMMDLWVSKAMAEGILLTGDVLRAKWKHFADLACIPIDERLDLSNGWLARYKVRANLKGFHRHGEAGSASVEVVETERSRIQELILQYGYDLKDNIEPNLTAHVQPMDQGIIRCFKAHYRTSYIERAIDCYDSGVTPSEIYDINQLEAMRLADVAWNEVDTTTIRHCWRKAGILPDMALPQATQPIIPVTALLNADSNQPDPITEAEKEVEEALDQLQSTGVLQPQNRMTIEALLNPAEE
ncbi:hypothetical protein C0993_000430, partial [Termitomyces sp. T159_Od127]